MASLLQWSYSKSIHDRPFTICRSYFPPLPVCQWLAKEFQKERAWKEKQARRFAHAVSWGEDGCLFMG